MAETENDMKGQHGGVREGAGRPPGKPSVRRAAQAIADVAARYPGWSPVLHFAAVANDPTLDPEIRLDAARAAAPYLHARPKAVVIDEDALVELEGRIAAARAKATVKEFAGLDQLAERLARAATNGDMTDPERDELVRLRLMVGNVTLATGVPRAPDEPVMIDEIPAPPLLVDPTPAVTPAPAEQAPVPSAPGDNAIIAAKPAYTPVLEWPEQSGPTFAATDYEAFSDGLLAGRNR